MCRKVDSEPAVNTAASIRLEKQDQNKREEKGLFLADATRYADHGASVPNEDQAIINVAIANQ